MRKLVVVAFAVFLAVAASADALIYKSSEKGKFTGGGQESSVTYNGYWVLELATTNLTAIYWYTVAGSKYYGHNEFNYIHLSRFVGKNRSFSTLTDCVSGPDSSGYAFFSICLKGQDQNLASGTGRSAVCPRTLKGTWNQIDQMNGEPLNSEFTLSLSYQPSMTVTNNDAGNSAETILSGLAGWLESKGYRPEQP